MRRPFRLEVSLSAAERAALDELRTRAGLGDADLARLALWRLGEWYELGLPLTVFELGAGAWRRRKAKPV